MMADEKIRMLQGVSSADTHHSANAFVIGPDGGLLESWDLQRCQHGNTNADLSLDRL